MLADVCSVLVSGFTQENHDSPALVCQFIDGVRGYLSDPFDYPKPVLHPSEAALVRLVLAAKTTQEFYDLPPAYYDRLHIHPPELGVNEEGNMAVKYSEEPYRPPSEPTEKDIKKTHDLLGRMREATETEP
jgi:hypothetical protein